MSRTEAATKLGINDSIENVVKEVEDSIEQQWEIQNHCEMMAKAEDAIYLQSGCKMFTAFSIHTLLQVVHYQVSKTTHFSTAAVWLELGLA